MLKKLPMYILWGVAYGCTYFVGFCLIFYYTGNKDALRDILENFPTHAFASMLVGVGFGTTPVVYASERMSLWQQTLIHFVCGVGTFMVVAYFVGWIPFVSIAQVLFIFLGSTLIFLAFWACFLLYSRLQSKQMNNKLKSLPDDTDEQNKA